MNVETLFELEVLTTCNRLEEREEEMVDVVNRYSAYVLSQGMMVPYYAD